MLAQPLLSLEGELAATRGRTLRIVSAFHGERLLGPQLAIVNPPLWEIGHVGWFQEHWCLRYREGKALAPSILPHADPLSDSSNVAHDTRRNLPLPSLRQTRQNTANVRATTVA